jgi:predicted O-linked N-acetylglucosamine transferase (SPINDLY family)
MNDTLLENALRLRRAGRLADAAGLYAQILQAEPRHFEALHALGIVQYQRGQLEDALRLIGEAIAVKPDAAEAIYNGACLLARLNRTEEALAAFDAAIALKSDYIEALVNRGSLLARLNRFGEALTNYDTVVSLKPAFAEAWLNRAAVLLALSRFDEAIIGADRALALKPGIADAANIRARAMAARPSLARFERETAERDLPAALASALDILHAIDERFGRLDRVDTGEYSAGASTEDTARNFAARFAAAFGHLLTDPGLVLSTPEYERLLVHHRWIDLIFSLTPPGTSDALLPPDTRRRLILRSLNSGTPIDLDEVWREDPGTAAPAFLHYLASRCVFEPGAFEFRERLLEFLPDRLSEVTLSPLTLSRMADTYMHCSYALTPGKHAIKGPLMRQLRRACLEAGSGEISGSKSPIGERPTIVVVAENLLPGHSVHRTHSRAITSLKERFRVLGAVYPNPKGTEIESLFDDCVPLDGSDLFSLVANLSARIREAKPALIFYLGVGMVPPFVALASLRLAPIQCVSFGHTATTMSPAMDYFILPEDFVGSRGVFSERVLALPKAAMPFAPRPFLKPMKPPLDGTIRVALPASTMKLNPLLFDAVAEISRRAQARAEFHFFPLGGSGLPLAALSARLRTQIANAVIFTEMSHEAYLEHLNRCDFFLSPFPYGNMNSIVDAFQLGLPGVCLDGDEAHAHADGALFARIGLPRALVTRTRDEYVGQALRLIDDPEWRTHCRRIVASADLDAAFFEGDARLFCAAIADLTARA